MEYQNNTTLPPLPPQNTQEYDIPPLKPRNWLWQSILATLFCCIPFGVVGIIYAAKVDSLYFNGKYEESERMSRKARMWTLASVGAALLYVIFWIILFATGNLPEYMENIIERGASGYNF
ncbi:MAG: CD225/dispanin family protein [Proteiniphilum sp.]|jgi:fatty acid desaturase|uniref:CD225/dispanin family protein n=1 Tax=Proteiniphilum sp. TaxID=1926877 RepID=UPI0026BDBAFC|nr:CD225/dispanin family protein [Proteiniphilum sp.]MEA5128830.1 CD225/dispanin family protein [Proteiniphilum sp.]